MNRRTFLSAPASIARTGAAQGARLRGVRPAASSSHALPTLEPYTGPWNRAAVLHLLRRTVIAPTVAELREAEAMTMDALVTRLTTDTRPLPGPSRFVGTWLDASAIGWDSGRTDISNVFYSEMRRWWHTLMVNDGLSLRERMTLFWHNHFANDARLVEDARFLYLQNQLFRRHALGDFKDLVRRVTMDKSMLLFLNGRANKMNYMNENYARELQELFTIGIADNDGNPNYSHDDILGAARALTGWDWVGFGMQGDVGNNLLTGHNPANKTVYGQTITGNTEGSVELARLLNIIFEREETARYVIRKLYRFFVYTDVTLTPVVPIDPAVEQNIIAPLAAEFRTAEWDIAVVLRRLLTSAHFYDPGIVGAMVKSPVDLCVSTLRATITKPLSGDPGEFATQYTQQRAARLGQDLFHPPGVQGWQFHRSWISTSTLPLRRRCTDDLVGGVDVQIIDMLNPVFQGEIFRDGSWQMDVLAYARQFSSFNDPEALVRDIAEHLLAYPASAQILARLKAELVGPADYEWSDAPDEIRTERLAAMLRYLMRTSNYQLL